jgi:hypothetical protein
VLPDLHDADPGPWWQEDENLLFLSLEAVRIACEDLLGSDVLGPRDAMTVRLVHRHAGLAAYELSDGFHAQHRRALVELLRRHGPLSVPPAVDERERIAMLAVHAREIAGRDAGTPRDIDALARVRPLVIDAFLETGALIGQARLRQIERHARAAGYLRAGWQQRSLAPLPWNAGLVA